MELPKQDLLVNYLVSDQSLFTKVNPILDVKYFDPRLKKTVSFIKSYFDEYKASPTVDQIRVETGHVAELKALSVQELEYAENELEKFCKERAIEEAIYASPALVMEGKFGEVERLIRDAITVSLNRDLGIDYFADPEQRLKDQLTKNAPISTAWHQLDELLDGGFNRKELIIIAAPSGVGKSVTLSNLSRNLSLKHKYNGIYFSLELSEPMVTFRLDSIFSGEHKLEILRNITKTSIDIKKIGEGSGRLFVKRFPEYGTTVNHLRAYLKEFEIVTGVRPDYIVVDYLDLMGTTRSVSAENTFLKDKFVSEELRALADENNVVMLTASQLNRSALQLENQEDLSQANIAGGLSKIMTADVVMGLLQDEQQKSRGEMLVKMLKTRSSGGVGKSFMLKMNPKNLRLENIDESGERETKTLATYIKNKVATAAPAAKQTPSFGNLPFQI